LEEDHNHNPPYKKQSTSHSTPLPKEVTPETQTSFQDLLDGDDFEYSQWSLSLSPVPELSCSGQLATEDSFSTSNITSHVAASVDVSTDVVAKNYVKRPRSNTTRNTTEAKLTKLTKKRKVTAALDEAWEADSARDHDALMAKIELDREHLAFEEKRLELDKLRMEK